MRLSLFALAFGTLMLTGCADDLVGPEAALLDADEQATARAPQNDDASATLFTEWVGTDGVNEFTFDFQQKVIRSTDIFDYDTGRTTFSGRGSYQSIRSYETDAKALRIVEGVHTDGAIKFLIVDNEGVVARVSGVVSEDFDALYLTIGYEEGDAAKGTTFRRGQ
jgi:hypothetical protein